MSKTRLTLVLTAVIISVITALVAAVSAYTSLNQGYAGDKFENSLWEAKRLVAKEVGYEGALDAEHFQIFDDYSFLIWEDGVVVDEGKFESVEAIKAMDNAMKISDGHQSRHSKNDTPSIGYMIFAWALTIVFFFFVLCLVGTVLLYGLYRVFSFYDQHADATA